MLGRVATGALLGWIAIATAAGTARAQSPEEDFAAGVRAYDAGDYAAALAAFRRSYAARAVPDVLYNIAVSEERLGQIAEAVRDYQRFLRDGTTRALRTDAERRLRALASRVARVRLSVYPAGARVTLDGSPVGTAPLDEALVLAPGLHVLMIAHDGFRVGRRDVSVEAGQAMEISVALEPEGEIDPGPSPERREVAFAAPREEGPGLLPPLLVVASGVALVSGVVLFALGASDRARVEDPPSGARWSDVEAAYGRAATLQNVGLTLAISGIVGGAIGVGLWVSR